MKGPFNVTLTAHVTIALHLAIPHLDGNTKFEANLAKNRAVQYLEKHWNQVSDPFQAAMLTYILTLVDSAEKDAAFSRLFALRIQEGRCVLRRLLLSVQNRIHGFPSLSFLSRIPLLVSRTNPGQ